MEITIITKVIHAVRNEIFCSIASRKITDIALIRNADKNALHTPKIIDK